MRKSVRRSRFPDLTGMTIGTWRILYESKGEEKLFCMCQCLRCGVKKIILVCKFLKGYVLRCPECRIRQDLIAQQPDCKPEVDRRRVRLKELHKKNPLL